MRQEQHAKDAHKIHLLMHLVYAKDVQITQESPKALMDYHVLVNNAVKDNSSTSMEIVKLVVPTKSLMVHNAMNQTVEPTRLSMQMVF
jgi:hypothetical protein